MPQVRKSEAFCGGYIMTSEMKCNCGFVGDKGDFGELEIHSHGGSSSFTPRDPVAANGIRYGNGSRVVNICPKCGSLYCFSMIKKESSE